MEVIFQPWTVATSAPGRNNFIANFQLSTPVKEL